VGGPTWTHGDLKDLLRGDNAAWRRLLALLREMARACGRHAKLSPSEEDEVYGRTLMALLRDRSRKIRTVRAARALPAYLGRLLRAEAGRILKRPAARRPRLTGDVLDEPRASTPRGSEGAPPDIVLPAILRTNLPSLTEAQRTVLVLRYDRDSSWRDIAAATGRSLGAVKQLHRRALASLHRHTETERKAVPPCLKSRRVAIAVQPSESRSKGTNHDGLTQ
jgi:DNA-directed RNA polymerase specialized sigma24 family protein